MLFGNYGGMMRGGNTDATLVFGDGPLETPPTIANAWSAIVMHHEYWDPLRRRLADGALVMVNSTVFEGTVDGSAVALIEVPATAMAVDVGNIQAATMVMTGAYAAVTGLVRLDSLTDAVQQSLPSYRSQHVALNVSALTVGFESVGARSVRAWDTDPAGSVDADADADATDHAGAVAGAAEGAR
jgi:Pyruvate/2-oxoacid:ferredoxin oxidoreductase gamma subunit